MNYFLLIALLILFGLICFKNFKLGLALFIFLLPAYIIRFQFGGIPSTVLELCFFVLFLIWLAKRPNLAPLKKISWLAPMGLFLLAATINIFISPDKLASLGIWKAYFIEPILFFLILTTTLKSKKDWVYVLNALILSGLAIALFAIVQKFTGLVIPDAWQEERRVTSIFGYPNAVGLYLAPIMIICFGFIIKAIQSKKILPIIFYLLSFLIFSLAVFWSKTEAAWIAILAAIFIFCLFKKNLRYLAIGLLILLILIIALVPALREPALEKILLQDWSGQVRLTTWGESWNMLKANPIFGAGLSGYPLAMTAFHKADYLEIFQYPHNFILNFWAEIGLLGLAAWLWLMAKAGITGLKNIKKQFFLSALLISFLAVILIHGLVDVPYFKNDLSMMFWIFMALAFYLENNKSQITNHK